VKKILLATSAAFGAIPGLAVIKSGLGTPPGHKLLFGGVIEAFGALSLMLLWINRNKIKRRSIRKVTKLVIIFALLCFVFLTLYVSLFSFCVIDHKRGTAYYPLWTSGTIADMVTKAGSRRAAIEKYGIASIVEAIDEMPGVAIVLTTVILLFIYQGVFTTLSVMFGVLGFYVGKQIE
jgi:hypothetical protein